MDLRELHLMWQGSRTLLTKKHEFWFSLKRAFKQQASQNQKTGMRIVNPHELQATSLGPWGSQSLVLEAAKVPNKTPPRLGGLRGSRWIQFCHLPRVESFSPVHHTRLAVGTTTREQQDTSLEGLRNTSFHFPVRCH